MVQNNPKKPTNVVVYATSVSVPSVPTAGVFTAKISLVWGSVAVALRVVALPGNHTTYI